MPGRGAQGTKRGGHGAAEPEGRWWSKRWLAGLERTGWATRLERGQAYARAGRVEGLQVETGRLVARVQGSGQRPYEVEIQVLPLAPQVWRAVAATLSARARDAAELLAGRLPDNVEEAFAAAGGRLFPEELVAECTCPDWATPCKHVAAVCYVFAAQIDADPFLLFRLRGRAKEQLLADIERAGARPGAAQGAPMPGARGNRPEAVLPADFWAPRRSALPVLAEPGPPLGLPASLPEPEWWRGKRPLRELLAESYALIERACLARLRSGDGDAAGTEAGGTGGEADSGESRRSRRP